IVTESVVDALEFVGVQQDGGKGMVVAGRTRHLLAQPAAGVPAVEQRRQVVDGCLELKLLVQPAAVEPDGGMAGDDLQEVERRSRVEPGLGLPQRDDATYTASMHEWRGHDREVG